MKNIELSIANESDAAEISKFAELTFRQTFCGQAQYTDKLIDGYAANSLTAAYFRSCIQSSQHAIYLLRSSGVLAGFVHIEEREPPQELVRYHGVYLHRLYIERGFKGQGFGKILMSKAGEEAEKRGFTSVWLGVWEHNLAAQEFYRKLGFNHVGEWGWPCESEGKMYIDRDLLFVIERSKLLDLGR